MQPASNPLRLEFAKRPHDHNKAVTGGLAISFANLEPISVL